MTNTLTAMLAATGAGGGGGGDLMAILGWVTTFVTAVVGAALTAAAKRRGKEEGRREVHVAPNPLPVDVLSKLVTEDQLVEVKDSLTERLVRLEAGVCEDRRLAREAQGRVHARIDRVAESLGEVKGELKKITANLDLLLGNCMAGARKREC